MCYDLEEMKVRKKKVELRLNAIMKEADDLNDELEHLVPLIKVYERRTYDPIKEEAYVTEQILSGPRDKQKTARVQQTIQQREAQAFNTVRMLGDPTVKKVLEATGWSNSKVNKTLADLVAKDELIRTDTKPYRYSILEFNA